MPGILGGVEVWSYWSERRALEAAPGLEKARRKMGT
jgi:hypothetical protein